MTNKIDIQCTSPVPALKPGAIYWKPDTNQYFMYCLRQSLYKNQSRKAILVNIETGDWDDISSVSANTQLHLILKSVTITPEDTND